MRSSLLYAMLILTGCQATPSKNPGPFEKHVLEALKINEARLPIYQKMSGSKSNKISRQLIFQQKMSIGIAQVYDKRAQTYREMGIPLLEQEFISMSEIANLDPEAREETFDQQKFKMKSAQPDIKRIKRDLRRAYENGGLSLLAVFTDLEIQRLSDSPHVFCMTRHFLESIRRAANYGTLHQSQAESMGESTEWLSWDLIDLHLRYLGDALELDLLALPIQAQGIPIICRDVPHIPAW